MQGKRQPLHMRQERASAWEKPCDPQRARKGCLGLTFVHIRSWPDRNACPVTNVWAPLCTQTWWPGRHTADAYLLGLLKWKNSPDRTANANPQRHKMPWCVQGTVMCPLSQMPAPVLSLYKENLAFDGLFLVLISEC